ncbi:hypothetical protein C2R66_06350 [Helicobacter pylori]|uniref:hypothetical protein n=1 Tax=Helicobacter pylori TaxID=210 RepID=UPI000D3700F7|nr:hypothetical protein [Helicobacter pylori]PUD50034.1 hypothetical protein C2R65_02550 [Helicobacter pylori]PUD50150.1 hypothetical protein C2R66_06350 [Helicobacter pylori]
MNPLLLNPLFFERVDEKSFLVFFITNDKRACQKQAIVLKMKNLFSVFDDGLVESLSLVRR